jgi:gamma-glutamyltranspeptidase/glutathione hydrolase
MERKTSSQYQNVILRILSMGFISFFLSSCNVLYDGKGGDELSTMGQFYGGVVADEPQAVSVGTKILHMGGSAADAAVALFFTMSVTYPSNASLGSGGVCLVHHPGNRNEKSQVSALEFLSVAPASSNINSKRKIAIPGAVMGMDLLHAKYGKLRWEQLIAPAEKIALLGHPISAAFANDLNLVANNSDLFEDLSIKNLFSNDDEKPLQEGEFLIQRDLAETLSKIRVKGARAFYKADLSESITLAARNSGLVIFPSDLNRYKARWNNTVTSKFGNHLIHVPKFPVVGGITAMSLFSLLHEKNRWINASPEERPHLFVEASIRAFSDRGNWFNAVNKSVPAFSNKRLEKSMENFNPFEHLPTSKLEPQPLRFLQSPVGASFVVIDSSGLTIACVISMNNLFGAGRMAQGTGIILAAPPRKYSLGLFPHAPLIISNPNSGSISFAGVSTGGITAPSALGAVMANALLGGKEINFAISAPRIHHSGDPDYVVAEPNFSETLIELLRKRGHMVTTSTEVGRVNAVYCSDGSFGNDAKCFLGADDRSLAKKTYVQF